MKDVIFSGKDMDAIDTQRNDCRRAVASRFKPTTTTAEAIKRLPTRLMFTYIDSSNFEQLHE